MIKLEAAKRLAVTAAYGEVAGPCTVYFSEDGGIAPMKFRSVSAKSNWEFSKKCRDMGSRAHMRVGHYSIITFDTDDLGISKDWEGTGFAEETSSIKPGTEFWESHGRDRTSQCKKVIMMLKQLDHPLKKQVLQDAKEEIAYWNQK